MENYPVISLPLTSAVEKTDDLPDQNQILTGLKFSTDDVYDLNF